jgi:hypothetical protein
MADEAAVDAQPERACGYKNLLLPVCQQAQECPLLFCGAGFAESCVPVQSNTNIRSRMECMRKFNRLYPPSQKCLLLRKAASTNSKME